MASVPGLFHDMDRLNDFDKLSGSKSYLTVQGQAKKTLSELYDWPMVVMKSFDLDDTHQVDDDMTRTSGLNLVLPPKNQAVAAALAIYYATILTLATTTYYFDLPLHLPTASGTIRRKEEDSAACDPAHKAYVRKTLACEICHLVTATLRGEQSTSTAFFFIFSSQVAHQHLCPDTPEGLRMEGLLDLVIAEKHGFETGRTKDWAAFFKSPPNP